MATATVPRPDHAGAHARAARAEARLLRAAFAPPLRMSIRECADEYLYLPPELAANRGPKYSSANAPYQREPMEVASDRRTRRLVLMWASQLGKSLILQAAIAHRILIRPRPMLMVQPTIEFAEAWSKERFAPIVAASPALAATVRDPKSRSNDNTLRLKLFPGGFLAIVGSNAPAGLAGRSIADCFFDEIDRFNDSAGSEGDAIALGERRQAIYGDALTILTSTPGNAGESRIEPAYQLGDQRCYFVPCPHCGHRQLLEWGDEHTPYGLKWASGKPETAAYLCAGCQRLIQESRKPWMLAEGQWIPQNPDGRYPSFALNGLYSPFDGSTWPRLVETWLTDKKNPEKLKVFVNTVLNKTWEEPGERIESHTLMQRLEEYPVDADGVERVPAGVAILTAGVDVQGDRLEVRVWGWGAGEESWLIRAEQIMGDPGRAAGTKGSPWDVLDEILRDTYIHEGGAPMRIATTFIDSGYATKAVYQYARERVHEGVFAVKGVGGAGVHLLGKGSYQGRDRVYVYPVGVDTAKDSFLRSRLFIPRGEPGYVHLPTWATAEELAGLTSEKRITRLVRGRIVREWVKVRDDARNEALDCQNYAHAALHRHGLGFINALGEEAARLMAEGKAAEERRAAQAVSNAATAHDAEQEPPDAAPVRRPAPRRGGYINAWRR